MPTVGGGACAVLCRTTGARRCFDPHINPHIAFGTSTAAPVREAFDEKMPTIKYPWSLKNIFSAFLGGSELWVGGKARKIIAQGPERPCFGHYGVFCSPPAGESGRAKAFRS